MKEKVKNPKKLIQEQIKYFRSALENLEYNLNELERTVAVLPSRQLDADEESEHIVELIENFTNKLQDLSDDACCLDTYTDEIERIFNGK